MFFFLVKGLEGYSTLCTTATATFAAISQTIICMGESLRSRAGDRRAVSIARTIDKARIFCLPCFETILQFDRLSFLTSQRVIILGSSSRETETDASCGGALGEDSFENFGRK